MLQKQTASNGVTFYFSPLLRDIGVPHAFSTRLGGVSPAPFDSLNLGNPSDVDQRDDYARIWTNYELLENACGCEQRQPTRVHQVHGGGVARVAPGIDFDNATQADALVSDDPTRVLSVRVADCVPVLLADKTGDRVAAIHAGWRGVLAGVVVAALVEMNRDRRADFVLAAIGPSIGIDAFEVGPEIAAEFARTMGSEAPMRRGTADRWHVDLRAAIAWQLKRAGIPAEQIDQTDRCTFRDRDEFFSHRRERGVTGRMSAIIQCARQAGE